MSIRPNRVLLPRAAAFFLLAAASALHAQDPAAAKAAPKRLVLTTSVPDVRAAYDAGVTDLLNGKFVPADQHFRRALELDPGLGLVRASHAAWAVGLPRPERLRELDRAVADAARATPAELLTAAALREWVRGDAPAWSACVRAARALAPDDEYLASIDAGAALMGGRPADAVSTAQEFVTRHPDAAPLYNMLGYGLAATGHPAEALAAIQQYVKLLPDQPNPHDSYGELLLRSGRLEDAEREYRRAVELDPDFVNSYRGLASVLQRRRAYMTARAPLEAVVAHAASPEERADGERALAFNAVFIADWKTVRLQLAAAAAEAEKAGLAPHAAFTHGYLGLLEAAAGNAKEAARELALREAAPAWNRAVGSALADGALERATAVDKDLAALEATASTPGVAPDALPLMRLISRAVRRDLAGARTELAAIKAPGFRLLGQAFVLRAAREAKDAGVAQAAQAEMARYERVDGNSAFTHRLVGLP